MPGWDKPQKAMVLATMLRDSAVGVLQNLTEAERLDYDTLTKALQLRFGDEHLTELLYGQLQDRIQLPKESLKTFAEEIYRLAKKAFINCPNPGAGRY